MTTRWEYTTLKIATKGGFFTGMDFNAEHLAQELNKRGANGWELVSMLSIDHLNGGSNYVLAVMKRPKA